MSKDQTLKTVRREMDEGDLGKARDRLQGLLSTYPDDLEIRRLLGEVYWKLRQPAMAGRYWYLEPATTPEMEQALGAFEKEHGGASITMIQAIRFRGHVDDLDSDYARDQLLTLEERCRKIHRRVPVYGARRSDGTQHTVSAGHTLSLGLTCLILLTVLALIVIGLVTILNWIFG